MMIRLGFVTIIKRIGKIIFSIFILEFVSCKFVVLKKKENVI
jgi:hypothetical protein